MDREGPDWRMQVFIWTFYIADNLHEMPSLIFSEEYFKL